MIKGSLLIHFKMSTKKKKNILIYKPVYKDEFPPLGLMKISTWHKQQSDDVQYLENILFSKEKDEFEKKHTCYCPFKEHYDIIYITSLFTYYSKEVVQSANYFRKRYPKAEIKIGGIAATLVPDYFKENTGIEPFKGLMMDGPEFCSPDYSLFPHLRHSISFTTRGCPRSCSFCSVSLHEPEFILKEDWEKDIDITKNSIVFWDNNWFASPNLEKDVQKLIAFQKVGISQIDFNQGLDCRLFDEEKAKLISKLKINPMRFAFDDYSEDGHIQKAIQLAQQYGFREIDVYVLYNSNFSWDDPEYFYYRINEINKAGGLSYPMRYRPINSTNGQFLSPKWDKELLRALKLSLMFFYSKGMISKKKESFEEIYGKSPTQFKKKLYDIFEKDKEKSKRKSS
ncbi:MAG: hypothetical protein QME42_07095 [bacterium]|nr:hypothetical protein [bacterium]